MALIIMFSFFRTVFRRKFAVNILGIKKQEHARSRLLRERIHNDCETKTSKTSSLSLSLFRYRDLRRRSLSLSRIVTIRYTASFVFIQSRSRSALTKMIYLYFCNCPFEACSTILYRTDTVKPRSCIPHSYKNLTLKYKFIKPLQLILC